MEADFKVKRTVVSKKRIHYSREDMIENLSLGITVCHHSASLLMPNGDPLDGFFHYSHEGRIKKSVPRNHRLSSLGKPCDAKM